MPANGPWYVFNVADAAIVAGVIGLILDSLFPAGRRQGETAPGDPAARL